MTNLKSAAVQSAMRQLADSATSLVWMTDADGICNYLNSSALASLVKPSDFHMPEWANFIHPVDRARIRPIFNNAKQARKEYQVEYRIVKSNGDIRWMLSSGAPRFSDSGEFAGYVGTIVDSSAQHETKEELQRSEERFRSLTKLSADWYWETDAAGRFTFISEGAHRLFGSSPDNVLGKTRLDRAADPSEPGLLKYLAEVSARKPFRDLEYSTYDHFKKRIRHASISGEPVFEEDRFVGYRGIGRDISERMAVANQLAALGEENRALIENSPDIIALLDEDGHFLRLNKAVKGILGYEPDELIGRRYRDFLYPADHAQAFAADASLRNGINTVRNVETRWVRKDGGITRLSFSAHYSSDLRLTYVTARDVSEAHIIRLELVKTKDQMVAMLESIGDAFFTLDRSWRATYVNQKTADFLGLDRENMVGKLWWEAVPEILQTSVLQYFRQAMESGERTDFEVYWEKNQAWVDVRVYPNEEGISVFFHDITSRRESENALRNSEEQLQSVIKLTPAGYAYADAKGNLLNVNPALCAIGGYSRGELIGQNIASVIPGIRIGQLFAKGGSNLVQGRELVIRHKNGQDVYVLANANIQRDKAGSAVSVTAFLTDITERKEVEERFKQLATHDTLTGLPNRTLINQRLQEMLDTTRTDESVAVMFIDLDRFKEVNDSLGHAQGDALLREVAQRLKDIMRPADIVARLGGDEFIAVANCSKGQESAEVVAKKLLSALARPFAVANQKLFVSASIGISLFPQDAGTKESLFQNADTAMYRAKTAGRNRYCFFNQEMGQAVKTKIALEQDIRHALEKREFELHYQPRIDLKTLRVSGMEALIRWNHPLRGQIPPLEFIPIAEECGQIGAIGRWVLHEACMQTQRFVQTLGYPLQVSVNLSARQLEGDNFLQHVHDALNASGLSPQSLELELTESALIHDMDLSVRMLRAMKEIGVALSVDDFGTGYSSLAYLQRFPLDTLKLDRLFLNQEGEGNENRRFIKAFIDLAHTLNLGVVAEGIESSELLQFLVNSGCDEGQGYLFSRPLSANDFEIFMASRMER